VSVYLGPSFPAALVLLLIRKNSCVWLVVYMGVLTLSSSASQQPAEQHMCPERLVGQEAAGRLQPPDNSISSTLYYTLRTTLVVDRVYIETIFTDIVKLYSTTSTLDLLSMFRFPSVFFKIPTVKCRRRKRSGRLIGFSIRLSSLNFIQPRCRSTSYYKITTCCCLLQGNSF
jgi:hypothetical protein